MNDQASSPRQPYFLKRKWNRSEQQSTTESVENEQGRIHTRLSSRHGNPQDTMSHAEESESQSFPQCPCFMQLKRKTVS